MSHETNRPVLRRIDEICDEYEASLKSESPLRIEDCLEQMEARHRPALFHELLEIELHCKLCLISPARKNEAVLNRETPKWEHYEARFPEYIDIIGEVFRRLLKPDRIGDYEILEELGRGGMGVVYKGVQTHLDQTVAIKVLPQALLDDPQTVARFRREMQRIGPLNHPNIVRALNAGESDGTHFLAMEYVAGVNLQKFVDRLAAMKKRLSFGAVCEIVRQAALGLQHAHEFELVHRDIKPANLMLDLSGTVKILDLGLGKFLSEKRSEDLHLLTRRNATMGTIDYMSPEQCENMADVDIRSDIYSLGCTFYFLVTGHPLYHEKQFDSFRKKMMAHIVGNVPRLADEIPESPADLEEILRRMLAKDRPLRFQTPLELAEALEPFADVDELHEFLDLWKCDHGIDKQDSGHSTKVISVQRTKKQLKRPKPDRWTLPHLARDWRMIAALIAIPVLAAVLLPFLFRSKDTIRVLTPEIEQAQRNIAQMPGMNGCWWFEEIPWFIPPVRELLLRKLAESPDTLRFVVRSRRSGVGLEKTRYGG